MHRTLLFGLLGTLVMTAERTTAQAPLKLVAIQHYGWESPEGPAGTASALRRLDGGMLAEIGEVVEGPGGALYVIDPTGCKIVVFNRDGSIRRIIGGGKGEGPGEFIRPISLALSDAGELYVLDTRSTRITVFDTLGVVKRTIVTGISNLSTVRVTHDRLYANIALSLSPRPLVMVFDLSGTLLDKIYVPSSSDRLYDRTGNTGRMIQRRDGSIVMAQSNPGTWSPVTAPQLRFGLPIVPDNAVREIPGPAYVASAALRGFAELANGRYLVLFDQEKTPSTGAPDRANIAMHLAILRPNQSVLSNLVLDDVGRTLATSRDGKEFFLSISDPFPQVVRYRLSNP